MNEIPKITLDNNCVINLFDKKAQTPTSVQALGDLIKLAYSNKIEVAITTRVQSDLENDSDNIRREAMMEHVKLIPTIGSIFRLDISHLDEEDGLVGEYSSKLIDDIQKMLFPGGLKKESKSYVNNINDIEHLVGHVLNKRDIFVTDDRGILKKKEVLEKTPGIVVMSPTECLEYVNNIENQKRKKIFEKPKSNKYYSPALRGTVTFDYSNNDGNYIIGEGYYLFDTHWSSASENSIHAYKSYGSVESIALVKGLTEINKIKDGKDFDNSSRLRSPEGGQIIILKNKNNIFAALKILDVKYDGRGGDDHDELTFEYIINPGGSADFTDI